MILVILSVFAALCTHAEAACDAKHGDSCYVIAHETLTWHEANNRCKALGGHLAIIDDGEENKVVFEIAKGLQRRLYINGQDKQEENVWRWANSYSKMTYVQWYPGEPVDKSGTEDCAAMMHDGYGAWIDVNCDTQYSSLCEIRKRPRCNNVLGNSCYVINKEAKTWQESRDHCQSLGGHIIDVDNAEESQYVTRILQSLQKSVWIDGKKDGSAFMWSHSGLSMNHQNWNAGEPSGHANEDCVNAYFPFGGKWNNNICSEKFPSICELTNVCHKGYNGNCYVTVSQPMAWRDANVWCEVIGGHLADVQNAYENDILQSLSQALRRDIVIDGSDDGHESVWKWRSINTKMFYNNWRAGEPNNGNGVEHCAMLYQDDGKWNDVDCASAFPFVCEIKARVECDKTWSENCYVTGRYAHGWRCSQARCQNMGGRLVDISSSQENDFVFNIAKELGSDLYTDATDDENEGSWKWFTTDTPHTYTNYAAGVTNSISNNCMTISHVTGEWNYVPCTSVITSLCKLPGYTGGMDPEIIAIIKQTVQNGVQSKEAVSTILQNVRSVLIGRGEKQASDAMSEKAILCRILQYTTDEYYDYYELAPFRNANCKAMSESEFNRLKNEASARRVKANTLKQDLERCKGRERTCRCFAEMMQEHSMDEEELKAIIKQLDPAMTQYCGRSACDPRCVTL